MPLSAGADDFGEQAAIRSGSAAPKEMAQPTVQPKTDPPNACIVSKRLIEPVAISSYRPAMAIIGGLLLFIMLASGFSVVVVAATCTLGLLTGLFLLVPLELLIRALKVKSAVAALATEGRTAMVAFIGREPMAIDTRGSLAKGKRGRLSATGIAWDGQRLYVLDSGTVGAIPMAAVRSWTWRTERAAQTKVYGSGGSAMTQFQVAEDNMAARAAAFQGNGFFVSVTDIAKPVWQFMTEDVAVLERWDEILRQVREGRLAP